TCVESRNCSSRNSTSRRSPSSRTPWTRSLSTARSAESGENRVVQASEHLRRIEDYALLGDLQTAALIDRGGSIDWCCFPRFDSGACFARLLGGPECGGWLLAPSTPATSTRRYLHDTLVLETTWTTEDGSVARA